MSSNNSLKATAVRILRWSERYTKTDMVYLASGGFWSLVGQAAASLTSLVFAIAVSHLVSKDAYGTYKYILSIISLLGAFSLSGLGTAVFQSAARGLDGALYEGFWTNIRWSIVMFAGAFAFAFYYWSLGNLTLAIGILLGGCLSPFLTSANLSSSFLSAKKDFKRQAIYFDLIENLIPVALLIATIIVTQNPAVIAVMYFLSNTLVTLWLYRRVVQIYKPDPAAQDTEMLLYSKHLSVMGVLSSIAGNIDQALLFHFTGPVEVAIYNFATAIPDQTKGPLKMLDQMIQARFVTRATGDIRRSMTNKTVWLFILSVLCIALYLLIAPFIYKILFPSYTDAVLYSRIYALSFLSTALAPAGSYLTAKKRVWEQYVSNIVLAVARIIAMFVGVVYWGLIGLVVAVTLVRLCGNFFTYALYAFSPKTDQSEA